MDIRSLLQRVMNSGKAESGQAQQVQQPEASVSQTSPDQHDQTIVTKFQRSVVRF